LRNPQGFTRRIVKDEDGDPHWEIFCKAHAKAVSDPIKKSSKNKNFSNSTSALFEEDNQNWDETDTKPASQQGRRQSVSADTAVDVNNNLHVVTDLIDDMHIPLEDDDDNQSDSDDDEKPSGLAGALQEQSASSFPALNLIEWPGQSEGDGMDLDHFWNFTSSFFAEDHTREWFQYMKNGAKLNFPKDESSILQLSTALKSASKEDLEELLEEVNDSFSNERNRSSALYYDKRNRFLDEVERNLDVLSAFTSNNDKLSKSVTEEAAGEKDNSSAANSINGIATVASKLFSYYQHKRFSYDDEHVFLSDDSDSNASLAPISNEEDAQELKVVFDGSTRISAIFNVASKQPVSKESIPEINVEEARNFLFPTTSKCSSESVESSRFDLSLDSFEYIPYDKKLVVSGKSILAKDDITILQKLLQTDYHAYVELVRKTRNLLDRAILAAENDKAEGKEVELYEASKDIHMSYVKQQVWKWVCSSMHNGVCDQRPGAYKSEEALPASWAIQVPGRPSAPTKEENEEKESHEDIVCMCCFDGSFAEDRNQILFCDGCNATMHQKCYGIGEIPEGQFYCDRCSFIQRQYHDEDVGESFLKNVVRCCLCPLYHGGLKRTTDKRWVHLCCALFAAGHTTIHNLSKMSHIDISDIPMQNQGRPLVIPKTSQSSRFSAHPDACVYCQAYGGYVVTCQHKDKDSASDTTEGCEDSSCKVKFHPICAWFAGNYIHSEILDASFQGKDRNGLFPSGLQFTYYCAQHDQAFRNGQSDMIRAEQIAIRSKYRINEYDLAIMPGKNNKRKNRRQNKKSQSDRVQNGAAGRGAAAGQVQKELVPDHYTDKLCAICMKPTTDDLFGSGYDSQIMSSITLEYDDPTLPSDEHVTTSSTHGSATDDGLVKVDFVKTELSNGSSQVATEDAQMTQSVEVASPSEIPVTSIKLEASSTTADETIQEASAATAMGTDRRVLACQQCGINVHFGCLQSVAPSSAHALQANNYTTPWSCSLCATNSDVLTVDCALCPRHGGIFCPTIDHTMVHPYCARTLSQVVVESNSQEDVLDLKQFVKDANRKQKCGICNRKKGLCLPCSEVGCQVYFHPLCGLRSGKGFVRVSNKNSVHSREAFCQDHIPPGIEMSSTGFWIDGYELGHMRHSLDRARIILDMLIKREKFKKAICKTELDLFTHRFNKAFARATGKKLHTNATDERDQIMQQDTDLSDYVSDDEVDELDEEIDAQFQMTHGDKFVLLTDFPQAGKKVEKVPFVHPKTEEVLHISPTWTKYGEVRRPKNMRTSFAGHQMFPRDVIALTQKAFVRMQLEKIHRHADGIREYSAIFSSRKEEDNFGKKLHHDLLSQTQMSDKEFLEHMREVAPFVEIPRTGVNRRSLSFHQTPADSNTKKGAAGRKETEEEDHVDDGAELAPRSHKKKSHVSVTTAAPVSSKKGKRGHQEIDEDDLMAEGENDGKNTKLSQQKNKLRLSLASPEKKHQDVGRKRKHNEIEDEDDDGNRTKHGHAEAPKNASHVATVSLANGAYHEQLQTIRSTAAFDEFVKHFHFLQSDDTQTGAKRRGGATNRDIKPGFGFICKSLFDNTKPRPTSTSNKNGLDGSEGLDLFAIAVPGTSDFIWLERVLFHVLDSLGQIEDSHSETVALIAENKAQRLLSPRSRSAPKKQPQFEKKTEISVTDKKRGRKPKGWVADSDNPSESAGSLDEREKYMLVDEYEDIPYEDLPHYDEYIRRAISINKIKERLQSHGYRSLACFVNDFYTLMNNARHVATMANVKIRDNTKQLGELFGNFLTQACVYRFTGKNCVVPLRYDLTRGGQRLTQVSQVSPSSKKTTSSPNTAGNSTVSMLCWHCSREWEVHNWPDAFEVPTPLSLPSKNAEEPVVRKSRRSTPHEGPVLSTPDVAGGWYCQHCVVESATEIVAENRRVQVWWRGDGCAYVGHVQAYEPQAQCFQILYEDDEWEFVNMAWEPYLFC
jgi:hypothetical protein